MKKTQYPLRIEETLYRAVTEMAQENERSVNKQIVHLIRDAVYARKTRKEREKQTEA